MRSKKRVIGQLVEEHGRLFSDELGIDVASQPFRWLLASILLGGRISGTIAQRTYRAFERRGLLTPKRIFAIGWDGLIPVMGEGGYTRYDGITSSYIIGICNRLLEEYGGKVESLATASTDNRDLERRLLEFRGMGPVRVSIFLRELRGIWKKANPALSEIELRAARSLSLTRRGDPAAALEELQAMWAAAKVPAYDFRHLEAALLRKGLELRRHGLLA